MTKKIYLDEKELLDDREDKSKLLLDDYNADKKYGFQCEMKITNTLFKYGFLIIDARTNASNMYQPGIMNRVNFWDNTFENSKSEESESLSGDVYLAGGKVKYKGGITHVLCHDERNFHIEAFETALGKIEKKRPIGGSDFWVYLSEEVIDALRKYFFVSSLKVRFNNKKYLEKIQAKVIYYIINGKPYLDLDIVGVEIETGIAKIDEFMLPVDLCKEVENLFYQERFVSTIHSDKQNVYWKQPTNWMSKEAPILRRVHSAVYMWKASDHGKSLIHIDYINDATYSLYDAVLYDENKYHAAVELVRFAELDTPGMFDTDFILENVVNTSVSTANALLGENGLFQKVYSQDGVEEIVILLPDGHEKAFINQPTDDDVDIKEIEGKYPDDCYKGFFLKVRQMLANYHICVNNKADSEACIYSPCGWFDKEEKQRAASVFMGLYNWFGYDNRKRADWKIYIGIVGVVREGSKNKNSVYNRIFVQEQRDRKGIACLNDVTISQYRFIEFEKDYDDTQRTELLQTLEMQSINNISSLFGYNAFSQSSCAENTIMPLYDGVVQNAETHSLQLLNRDKRYHVID